MICLGGDEFRSGDDARSTLPEKAGCVRGGDIRSGDEARSLVGVPMLSTGVSDLRNSPGEETEAANEFTLRSG